MRTAVASTRITVGLLAVGLFVLQLAVVLGLYTGDHGPTEVSGRGIALDYDRLPTTLTPLDPAWIAQALGKPSPTSTALDGGANEHVASSVDGVVRPLVPDGAIVDHVLVNDERESAIEVTHLPFRARTDAGAATRDADDPGDCQPVGDTIWYRWTPERHRLAVATTADSDGPTSIAVLVQGPDGLETVRCGTTLGSFSEVGWAASAGQTYWLHITAPVGAQLVQFQLTATSAPRSIGAGEVHIAADATLSNFSVANARSDTVFDQSPARPPEEASGQPVATRWGLHRLDAAGNEARIDVARDEQPSDRGMFSTPGLDMSADGRLVAFGSLATNLVDGDTNDDHDYFVHDSVTGLIERLTVRTDGSEGMRPTTSAWRQDVGTLGRSEYATNTGRVSLTADGRHAWFDTVLSLDDRDEPRVYVPSQRAAVPEDDDVYVRDRAAGTTTLLTLPDGQQPLDTWDPTVSADGSTLAVISRDRRWNADQSDGPADAPSDDVPQLWVKNLETAQWTLVSRGIDGGPADDLSFGDGVGMSSDGRFVTFVSRASNLVPNDVNAQPDVFLADLEAGSIELISRATDGSAGRDPDWVPGEEQHWRSDVTDDGRFVLFTTSAAVTVDDRLTTQAPDQGMDEQDMDVFLRDRRHGLTTLLNRGADGLQSYWPAFAPVIADDGRSLAFATRSDLSLTRSDEEAADGSGQAATAWVAPAPRVYLITLV